VEQTPGNSRARSRSWLASWTGYRLDDEEKVLRGGPPVAHSAHHHGAVVVEHVELRSITALRVERRWEREVRGENRVGSAPLRDM
jgi:hypothetical protein